MQKEQQAIFNKNISKVEALTTPEALRDALPISEEIAANVLKAREEVTNIIHKKDKRLVAVVGPCSIHDEKQALDYAERLAKLHEELKDKIYIVMRVYFEKPRTILGWKGLINDPHLDGSFDMLTGLQRARKILLDINKMGLPTATEMLDPLTPQYLSDLISWAAIGARTTESQTHRQMSSGLSMPVGFKNGTNGDLTVAVNATKSAAHPQSFIGINQEEGKTCIFHTKGNPDGHLVLRGGSDGPNYSAEHVKAAEAQLAKADIGAGIVVDCNHANSGKDPYKQPDVLESIVEQKLAGNKSIVGFMIESHIKGGNQKIPDDLSKLEYGISITDACIDWEGTEKMLRGAAAKL